MLQDNIEDIVIVLSLLYSTLYSFPVHGNCGYKSDMSSNMHLVNIIHQQMLQEV